MSLEIIQTKIYEIRDQKVMLDFDLAELYEVETKVMNQSVKRNITRFPEDFMFRLTPEEWNYIRSQIVTEYDRTSISSQIVTSSKKHRAKYIYHTRLPNIVLPCLQAYAQPKSCENEYCNRSGIYSIKAIDY